MKYDPALKMKNWSIEENRKKTLTEVIWCKSKLKCPLLFSIWKKKIKKFQNLSPPKSSAL